MGNIILDPEFRAVNRALTAEEAEALRAKIDHEGPQEPLWFGSGPLTEHLLDGFNRIAIYDEKGIVDYPTAHALVETRDDAINWIIDHQLSRRNLNDEERDFLLGKRYLREKAQGVKSPDGKTTAERLGEADGLSGKTVQRAAEFSKAVETIAENVGQAEAQEIRQGKAKIAKGKIAEIAKEPPAKQSEAYAKAKGSKSKAKAMSDAYEDEKKAARKKALDTHKPVAASGPPDLVGMVRDVNAAWTSDAVDAYGSSLTDGQKRELRAHLPDLQDKLRRVWVHAAPQSKKGTSRPAQWQAAASDAQSALETLLDLQAQYQDWLESLSEGLRSGATGEKLEAVCELDLEGAQSTISEAEGIDLPLGFNRD